MGDHHADALVVGGLALYAWFIGYAFWRSPALAVISAIIVAAVATALVAWFGD